MTSLPDDLIVLRGDLAAARPSAARGKKVRVAIAVPVIAAVVAGAALAAVRLIGNPAPDYLQSFLQVEPVITPAVLSTSSSNLGFAVDPAKLRVAIQTHDAVLYAGPGVGLRVGVARDVPGVFCTTLVVAGGHAFGAQCQELADQPFVVAAPAAVEGPGDSVPVTVSGRTTADVSSLEAVLPDGSSEPIRIAAGGYFLFESNDPALKRTPVTIRATLRNGAAVDKVAVPQVAVTLLGRRLTGRVWSSSIRRIIVPPSSASVGWITGVLVTGPNGKRTLVAQKLSAADKRRLARLSVVVPVAADGTFHVTLRHDADDTTPLFAPVGSSFGRMVAVGAALRPFYWHYLQSHPFPK